MHKVLMSDGWGRNMTSVSARDRKEKNGIICVMDKAWRRDPGSGSDIVSNDESRVYDT